MQSLYHQQTAHKVCKYCATPFIGHPNRDYCSHRCKRKAKESRYRTIAISSEDIYQAPTYAREYDVVTPETALSIFEFLQATKDSAVTVNDFMEPERIIVPASVTIIYGGKNFHLQKMSPELSQPSSRPLLEEIARTSPQHTYKP